jgi:DNA-directed RNA polymerase beta subunit
MGDFPWMTARGTFVINGTERVVVTQLVRSPGAYLMEPKDPEKQVFTMRYDLTRVGRYKLNSRLGLDVDLDVRTLTHDDILALVRELVRLPNILGISEELDEDLKDYAAEALSRPREAVEDHVDEYEHFGNRRLRTVGELIQEAFRIGLYRMERVVRERAS